MDPNATLARLTALVSEHDLTADDYAEMRELATALQEWITRGGFLPELHSAEHANAFRMLALGATVYGTAHERRMRAHSATAGFPWEPAPKACGCTGSCTVEDCPAAHGSVSCSL